MALWFAIGAVAGPVGWLVLQSAPPRRCQFCGTETRGWSGTCWWCREDVRGRPSGFIPMATRDAEPPASLRATPGQPNPEQPAPEPIRMAPDAAVPTPGSRRAITTKPRTTPPLPDPIASAPVVPAASVIQELTPAPPARPEPPSTAAVPGPANLRRAGKTGQSRSRPRSTSPGPRISSLVAGTGSRSTAPVFRSSGRSTSTTGGSRSSGRSRPSRPGRSKGGSS
jgi:hypothetical protein